MSGLASFSPAVMPGLVPGIHAVVRVTTTWMAGTSPAMTTCLSSRYYVTEA
jgi:hypothetical protein